MRSAIAGLIPKIYGTSTDAENIAKVCCIDSGTALTSGTLSCTPMILLVLPIVTSFLSLSISKG